MTWEEIIGPFQGATGKSVAETASGTTHQPLEQQNLNPIPHTPESAARDEGEAGAAAVQRSRG